VADGGAGGVGASGATRDPAALLTALTTEHFTLQGARAATISESTARAALFVGALSSALVALGFTSQVGERGHVFDVFAMVVLPTLYVLGLFTFVRLVVISIEDIRYGRAINRIRHFYLELAGDDARYFAMSGHDDTAGVLANMGVERPSRRQLLFTLASMISVLTAVVGGSATGFAASLLGAPLALATVLGAGTAAASLLLAQRYERRLHDEAREHSDVLFPS
jgi:hypothetical protein